MLFFDEVADMPRETQNKILRVLVDQTFQRVGGTDKVQVDVRVISSTGRDLEPEMRPASSATSSIHRLNVVPMRVPPLAERREDIPNWSSISWSRYRSAPGLPRAPHRRGREAQLQTHDWPGNVRQLRNNVERLMILAGGDPEP